MAIKNKPRYSIVKILYDKNVNTNTGTVNNKYIYKIKKEKPYKFLCMNLICKEYITYDDNDIYSSDIHFENEKAAKTYLDNEILNKEDKK